MSKNITIKEGGQDKTLTVDKLRTALIGGGSCLWIPEDSAKLGKKTINENGTYKASDDSLYGYSEVTVRGVGVASGKDDDGHDVVAFTDPVTGKIETESAPESISIVTLPTKTAYLDGETIDFTGLTVRALMGDGSAYDAEGYPGGMIPTGELTFPETVAHVSDADMSAEVDDPSILAFPENNPIILCNPAGVSDWRSPSYVNGYKVNIVASGSLYGVCIEYSEFNHTLELYSRYPFSWGRAWGNLEQMNVPEATNPATIRTFDGVEGEVYFASFGSSQERPPFPMNYFTNGNCSSTDFAKQIFVGTIRNAGRMEVSVRWDRPYDGKTLETSFEVDVTVPQSGGGGGTLTVPEGVSVNDIEHAISEALNNGSDTVTIAGNTYTVAQAETMRDMLLYG